VSQADPESKFSASTALVPFPLSRPHRRSRTRSGRRCRAHHRRRALAHRVETGPGRLDVRVLLRRQRRFLRQVAVLWLAATVRGSTSSTCAAIPHMTREIAPLTAQPMATECPARSIPKMLASPVSRPVAAPSNAPTKPRTAQIRTQPLEAGISARAIAPDAAPMARQTTTWNSHMAPEPKQARCREPRLRLVGIVTSSDALEDIVDEEDCGMSRIATARASWPCRFRLRGPWGLRAAMSEKSTARARAGSHDHDIR
jgi:hypothetical protein